MRLIDADALKEHIQANAKIYAETQFPIDVIIDKAPTVNDCPNCEYKINYDYLSSSSSYKELQTLRKFKKDNERPQGEWIEHYSKEMSEKGYFLCSRCKCGFQRFERGIRHSDLPWIDGQKYELHCIDNFCPNCGADMRGEYMKSDQDI